MPNVRPESPPPSAPRSSSTTRPAPRRQRLYAIAVPKSPPPITTTSARSLMEREYRGSPLLTVLHHRPDAWEAMVPSPRDDALSVPSRTVEHARTFVSWPCRADLWGGHLAEAEAEYAAVVEAIARFEPVTVIAPPGTTPRLPVRHGRIAVDVAEIPIDDSWVRDNGPIFVVDGRGGVAAVGFEFNAWGGKFAPFADDARLPARLAQPLAMRALRGAARRRGRRARRSTARAP